jgi:membrane-associated protease RseP (regulator of RpoE activity)
MALAGPATHFVIAIVLMFAVVFFAGDYRGQRALTTLREVSAGALDAGLRAGDEIVAVNGTAVREWRDVPALVSGTPERPRRAGEVVHIVVRRGDRVIGYDVTLREVTDEGVTRVVAGVAAQVHVPQPGLGASIATAPRQVFEMSWDALKSLGTMFSPSGISNYFRILAGETGEDTNPQNRFVSPIGFGKLASDAVKAGWVNALGLLIAINIFVGLFNLLPLLPFDGGHVAVATYEKVASTVRRRRVQVDMAKLMPVTVAVMALLLFIFLSSVFLDITKPISNPF